MKALYPTSTYGWNSGGEPSDIPSLTWEHLKNFHRTHYHPSNAFFYTYGNIPLEESLAFIEKRVLRSFERIDPNTEVHPEIRWDSPRKATYAYPLSKSENPSKKSQVSMAWLTADVNDSFDVLVLSLLGHILMGNAASPLRKALIDSKLGSALCDASGYDPENRDTLFACGLKDVDPDDAGKIESIIWDTLTELSENGVEKELIDTAIHQIEFRRKERTNTPYPYGIKVLLGISGPWFHGGDPVKALRLDEDLERLQKEMEKGPFFEGMIRKYFLDNPHRVLFTLVPDQEKEEKENQRVMEELNAVRATLTDGDLENIRMENRTLEELQASDEDLSCLPTLKVSDVPPDVTVIKPDEEYKNIPATCYRKPTSGIFYLVSAAGIEDVPEDLHALLPFFCTSFTRLGTKSKDYTALARALSAVTGGIGLDCHARTRYVPSPGCLPFISFNGKCLNRNLGPFFDLFAECALEFDFKDTDRLKSLLMEYRAGLESSVVQNGHVLAMSLAARNFSDTNRLSELWNGVTQVRYIKTLADEMVNPAKTEETAEKIVESFNRIAAGIFRPENFRFALVGEDEAIKGAVSGLEKLAEPISCAPGKALAVQGSKIPDEKECVREGWSTNSAVSFVAESMIVPTLTHPDAPGLAVLAKILRSSYLHREIREKGGAYGGFAAYNAEDGVFSMGSYRDPHIVTTLNVFEQAGEFLKGNPIEGEDVSEAILQVASGIDKPDTPGPAARKAFYRDIVSMGDDIRLNYKKGLLKLTRKDLSGIIEKYFTRDPEKISVAVISGEDKLKEANVKLGEKGLDLCKI
jgi:Zn-dependent M16 (insulinase) family peptidase